MEFFFNFQIYFLFLIHKILDPDPDQGQNRKSRNIGRNQDQNQRKTIKKRKMNIINHLNQERKA